MIKSEIAFVRSLSSKKERAASGLFVAEGEKLVGEMLASEFRVRKIFRCGEEDRSEAGSADTERVSPKEMERISALKTPTPVLALIELPRYRLSAGTGTDDLALALDGVQDPGNLGTIVRLADWFGIRDIVCSENTADCFGPKAVQATMGAIARVRVHYTALESFLARAAERGTPVYGTFLEGEDIYRAGLSVGGIVVMGSEGNGISSGTARCVTRRLFIPPYPGAAPTSESLNVAMATAVVAAEFRRRIR
uniref:TrmH family RNA methyltransferase n=1 Tax=Alistipes ihumii TaxID=1470347 RepID=UPI003FF0D142